MTKLEILSGIPGASELTDWFGSWPTFHDAEVVHLRLARSGISEMLVHTWNTSSELDERSYYKLEKHVAVSFLMSDVIGLSLDDFNHQNVLFGLDVEQHNDFYRLVLDCCYGVCGTLNCRNLAIQFVPAELAKGL